MTSDCCAFLVQNGKENQVFGLATRGCIKLSTIRGMDGELEVIGAG